MIAAVAVSAGLLVCVGAILLYLASPNQRWTGRPLAPRPLAGAGALALLVSLALLLGIAGPATAIFIWITLATTVWSLVPLAIAWLRRPAGEQR